MFDFICQPIIPHNMLTDCASNYYNDLVIMYIPLPILTSADDKPGLDQLQYMSYTGEDGRDVHFRLMDQLRPYWGRLAIALKFPLHKIAIMEKKDNPVYYLLSEWLRGANQEKDPRPVTWRTLIKALRHADVREEATVLEKYFIKIPVTPPNSSEYPRDLM